MRGITKEWKGLIASVLVTLILLVANWLICGINFETNDDTGIMMFVTGAKTGTPTAETIFCNILWGAFVSSLYKINNSIPWYTGIYMVLVWTVMSILFFCCIKLFSKKDEENFVNDLMAGGAVFCILYYSIFSFYTVMFQFTTIAALCGFGAMLLMLLYPKGNRYGYILCLILLFFADTIRPKIGYMVTVAVVVLLMAIYYLKKQIDKHYVFVTGGMQVATYVINALYEQISGWSDFRDFHKARWAWKDYAHPSFEEAQELYESVGWTEELYRLVDSWFFMDRRINTEAFEKLNSAIDEKSTLDFDMLKAVFLSEQLRITFIVLGVIIVGTVVYYLYGKNIKNLAVNIVSVLIAVTILGYFALNGRLPYRVSFSIIILFGIPVVLYLLIQNEMVKKCNKRNIAYALSIVGIVFALYSYFGGQGMMRMTYDSSTDALREYRIQTKAAIEEYAIEHPENIYVYDISLALAGSPFTTYSDGKPYNLTFWGGSGMYSPPYYDQLAANGLEEFYPEHFFDDNVFFMTSEAPNEGLLEYLRNEYADSVNTEIVYQEYGFIVYHIDK